MLILVHGSKGFEFINRIETLTINLTRLDCKSLSFNFDISTPYMKYLVSTIFMRLFNFSVDDYMTFHKCLIESSKFSEFIEKLSNTDFRNAKLRYVINFLISNDYLFKDPIIENCLSIPYFEPLRSIISILYVYWLIGFKKIEFSKCEIAIPFNYIDDLFDLLVPLKSFQKLYIYTDRLPKTLEIFDEIYLTNIPRINTSTFSLIKLSTGNEIKTKPVELKIDFIRSSISKIKIPEIEKFTDLELSIVAEIMNLLKELVYVNLTTLRDSISQELGIDKKIIDKVLYKLNRLGYIEIRFLPDGRIIVLPTLKGFVFDKQSFLQNTIQVDNQEC